MYIKETGLFKCARCNQTKTADEMTNDSHSKSFHKKSSHCKTCAALYRKKRIEIFGYKPSKTSKQKQRQRILRNKIKSIQYKGGKCTKCGYNKSVYSLGFHHINPSQKEYDPASLMGYSWKNIVKELDKCILVCANCHREIELGIRVFTPVAD